MMPNNAVTAWALGLILRRQGKLEQSIAYLTKAFEINPTSTEYASQAALTYASVGKLQGSDSVLRSFPSDSVRISRVFMP